MSDKIQPINTSGEFTSGPWKGYSMADQAAFMDDTGTGFNNYSANTQTGLQVGELYDKGVFDRKSPGFFGKDGFQLGDAIGLGQLGVGAYGAFLGHKQLGLAEDAFKYNKMDRDRTYAANTTKYNNSFDRTKAINDHYGVKTAGSKLG